MPGMSKIRSIRQGDSAANRRVVAGATATTTPPAPTASSRQGDSLNGADYMSVYAQFGGSMTAAQVRPYFWNSVHERWLPGSALAFDSATLALIATIQTQGEERVQFVVESVTGSGTLDLWAGRSNTGDFGEH